MKKILIFYGTKEFSNSLKQLERKALELKIFDKILIYRPENLPVSVASNPLFNYKKGGGYWVWKPYIIWKTLQDNPSSCVIYLDAGCTILPSPEWDEYFNIIQNYDTILFQYRKNFDYKWDKLWPNATTKIISWTKRRTQDYFDKLIKNDDWHNFEKIMGGFIIAKNPDNEFISQWLNISLLKPDLLMDPFGSEIENQSRNFIEHRHDQSIITPLAYYFKTKDIKILLETAESKIGLPAVIASRIRMTNTLSKMIIFKIFLKKILYKIKILKD